MNRTQEDASEKVLRLMLRVPEITAKMLIAGLSGWLKRMDEREPVGRQRLDRLMRGNEKLETSTIASSDIKNLDADMKVFERMARQYGVGYTAVKISDQPGYTILFKAKSKEAYATLITEYAKYQMARDFKEWDTQQEVPAREPSREPPIEGMAPGTVHKADIMRYSSIVPGRKQSIEDRIQRAKVTVASRNIANQVLRQAEKTVSAPKREREPSR